MSSEADTPKADDAVTNRSDDTALDESGASAASGEAAPILTPKADEAASVEESDAVGPDTEEQAAYEAVEAEEAAEANGDEEVVADEEAESEAEADESDEAEEPSRPSRGPIEEILDTDDDIRMDWYILKVQSNRERTIAEALERKMRIEGLDKYFDQVIVPTEKVTEFKGGKKKIVERKLYPGYIVVHMHINDDTWFAVRETAGVGDFTGANGKPSPMLASEVARIVQTEEEEASEAPKLDIRFATGDKVKVKEGNFESFEGEVNSIDEASGRVTVMINIFGRSTPVELEYWQIEAV